MSGETPVLIKDYTDPDRRFALRELETEDAAGLEVVDRVLFFPYLRHVAKPRKFGRSKNPD
jgi:hypothetical protein